MRVALGETQAIATTKAFLEEQGVNVSAFTSDGAKLKPRSKTAILVKNLPPDTEETDLRQLFGKHGALERLVLAPTKVLALAQFLEPTEARAAFSSLAYTRFKHMPLYLEWAPEAAFLTDPKKKAKKGKMSVDEEKQQPKEEEEADLVDGGSTLYVTNLNFDTTEATLMSAVKKKVAGIRAVTIATKQNPKGDGTLSRGFGFIEFGTSEQCGSAVMQLQGMNVDDHRIKVKVSTRSSAVQSGETPIPTPETLGNN